MAAKRVMVSAVAFKAGGPLTVLRDCLAAGRAVLSADVELHAAVHDRNLISVEGIHYHEFPTASSNWLRRVRFEYVFAKQLSAAVRPALWLSLHDASPRLNGEPQAVYCHNPAPFFSPRWRDLLLEPKLGVFRLCYPLVYRFNQHANDLVIVQQQWLRDRFARRFPRERILVAHPDVPTLDVPDPEAWAPSIGKIVLFYPTLPRAFKNVETAAAACSALYADGRRDIELQITLTGEENHYARWLHKKFASCPAIQFVGRLDQQAMARHYAACSALVFPSRLETWGLPLTEAKAFHKPILAADCRYARETVGTYSAVAFLPPLDSGAWQAAIARLADGAAVGTAHAPIVAPPFSDGWEDLWRCLAKRYALPCLSDD